MKKLLVQTMVAITSRCLWLNSISSLRKKSFENNELLIVLLFFIFSNTVILEPCILHVSTGGL